MNKAILFLFAFVLLKNSNHSNEWTIWMEPSKIDLTIKKEYLNEFHRTGF